MEIKLTAQGLESKLAGLNETKLKQKLL